jgi:anhydro-N-acetylmuramic acid kinase
MTGASGRPRHDAPTAVRAVGLISGTSMDGIDAAAVEIADGVPLRAEVRAFLTLPYPAEIRVALLEVCRAGEGTALAVCRLTMVLGEIFAAAAQAVLAQAGWAPHEVSLIGSHGQTTVSDMTEGRLAGFRAYSTLQLASPAVIAERTGITVVADFRARDIAAGGRGAPLVPLVDALLYARPGCARALLNLGGIANLTLLPASHDPALVLGFDTGPANMPLDAVMRLTSGGRELFDRDGLNAARGTVDPVLLQRLLAHPFLQRAPPKATGSEEFGDSFAAALLAAYPELPRDDLLATLAAFAAEAVATGLRRWCLSGEVPQEVLVSGGGVHNRALMEVLARALAPIPLRSIAAVGGHPDAKEALAFAVLGYLTLRGRAGNLPSVTGARHPVLLGSITPGRLGHDLLATLGTPSRDHEC